MRAPGRLDVDYDATAYYLFLKHNGDIDKVAASYRAFLHFAATLDDEAPRLQHVDPLGFSAKVLSNKVEYFRWKIRSERAARRAGRAAAAGTARAAPSGHSVLEQTPGARMQAVLEDVQRNLPSLRDLDSGADSGSGDDDDDNDARSCSSGAPEIFFSGIDWSKVKLPGDEGFSWDAPAADLDGDDGAAAVAALHASSAATPEERQKQLDAAFAALDAEAEAEERERQRVLREAQQQQQQQQQRRAPGGASQKQIAEKLLPEMMPSGASWSHLHAEMDKLQATEEQVATMPDAFAALKRSINPSRPKRPSDIRYDDDGYPLSPSDLPQALEHPAPAGARPAKYFTEFEPSFAAADKPAAEKQQQQQQQQQPAAVSGRSHRWQVIEHSDSDSEDAGADASAGKKGAKGTKGGKGGKGARGTAAAAAAATAVP